MLTRPQTENGRKNTIIVICVEWWVHCRCFFSFLLLVFINIYSKFNWSIRIHTSAFHDAKLSLGSINIGHLGIQFLFVFFLCFRRLHKCHSTVGLINKSNTEKPCGRACSGRVRSRRRLRFVSTESVQWLSMAVTSTYVAAGLCFSGNFARFDYSIGNSWIARLWKSWYTWISRRHATHWYVQSILKINKSSKALILKNSFYFSCYHRRRGWRFGQFGWRTTEISSQSYVIQPRATWRIGKRIR